MASHTADYSRLERLLHRMAFSGALVQRTAADVEDSMFPEAAAAGSAARPIFITSLPRAGTTILLEALASLPQLASHTYRDMPFVMAPILWSRLGRRFHKDSRAKERAHGDGLEIGYDSPEAFEEVLWRTFWPGKYSDDGIDLWQAADRDPEATAFFRNHFRKIVALRCPANPAAGRYVSKNNANVARLDLLPEMFADGRIVVPIRSPVEHAASLLRQHLNFTDLHRTDPFARRYMRDIGHLEFGELHRPIRFPGLAERLTGLAPSALDYWLVYWIAAFRYVEARTDRVILVAHEAVRRDGRAVLERLLSELGVDADEADRATAAALFAPETPGRRDLPEHSAGLRDEAETLYQQLLVCAA